MKNTLRMAREIGLSGLLLLAAGCGGPGGFFGPSPDFQLYTPKQGLHNLSMAGEYHAVPPAQLLDEKARPLIDKRPDKAPLLRLFGEASRLSPMHVECWVVLPPGFKASSAEPQWVKLGTGNTFVRFRRPAVMTESGGQAGHEKTEYGTLIGTLYFPPNAKEEGRKIWVHLGADVEDIEMDWGEGLRLQGYVVAHPPKPAKE